MIHISVGDVREEWKNGADGYIMEYSEDCGLSLHVFLNGVSPQEREQFATDKPFEIRFVVIKRILFFCLKFGNMDWADCAFSPNLYSPPPCFGKVAAGQGLALNILLIDSGAGELLNVRLIGLGHEFSESFQTWCKLSLEMELSRDEYMKRIDSVYSEHSTLDLVGMTSAADRYRL